MEPNRTPSHQSPGPDTRRGLHLLRSASVNERALAELTDRQAIVDVVIRYATGVDRRDWALYASCFTDPCEFDFSGWRGQPAIVTSPAEWATKVRSTNGKQQSCRGPTPRRASATCRPSTVQRARLRLGHAAEPRWCTLGGFYTTAARMAGGSGGASST